MIDAREVTDAVLVVLRAAGVPVGDNTAPEPRPAVYGILELLSGGNRAGSLGDPEAHLTMRFRIRGVATSATAEAARQASQYTAHQLLTAALNRTVAIQGTAWRVTGREAGGDGGTSNEGPMANTIYDFDLFVTKRASA